MVLSRDVWPRSDYTALRAHLVEGFRRSRPQLVVLSAPSGYGKSVVAGQFACVDFEHRVWIDLSGQSVDASGLLEAIAPAFLSDGVLGCPEIGLVPCLDSGDILAAIASALSGMAGGRVLLVVDGLHYISDLSSASTLALTVARVCDAASTIVLTTRELEDPTPTPGVSSWFIEARDLLLDGPEVQDLVAQATGKRPDESTLATLAQACGGHAATLSIMARHLSNAGYPQSAADLMSQDLHEYLVMAARASLDSRELEVLTAAALLGTGTLDDLEIVSGNSGRDYLNALTHAIPLVQTALDSEGELHFRVHELASESFTAREFVMSLDHGPSIVAMAKKHLRVRADFGKLLELSRRWDTPDEYAKTVEVLGSDILERGQVGLLRSAIGAVSVSTIAMQPKLLLMRGKLERLLGKYEAASRSALAAYGACRHSEDEELIAESRLLWARTILDMGEHARVADAIRDMEGSGVLQRFPKLAAIFHSYMVPSLAQSGAFGEARRHVNAMMEVHRGPGVSAEVRAHTLQCCLWLLGPLQGDWASTIPALEAIRGDDQVSVAVRLQASCNLAWSLSQTGRLVRALALLKEAECTMSDAGLTWLAPNLAGTRSIILLGLGHDAQAEREHRLAAQGCADAHDSISIVWSKLTASVLLRARGAYDESLIEAEEALAGVLQGDSEVSSTWATWARTEVGASLLALGDNCAVERIISQSMEEPVAPHNALRLELLRGEWARRHATASSNDTISRIGPYVDYILTESANWEIAMYIRAFPGLLGLVAAAVGVDRLPAHMLRMIMPEHARIALPLARDVLDEDSWKRLAVRLLGEDDAQALQSSFLGEPVVQVRLFGGLEVITPDGVVSDRAWRKRKARLLFIMLVTRQGRDVPRDVLLEHLWPEMDEERAKNNFYVIWSAMKRALLPSGKVAPCPYVEHVGGICRVVRPLVRSDLDDFDEALAELDRAESAGDTAAAIASARRIREVYRADLLPSEIYDDWFRSLRERYRVQFGDAMLRAARMCRDAGDFEQAVQLVRAGLEHDPWREDLYQAAIRNQIDTGQRSGAVDTFMACRSKLAEDLGLDPSLETRRLYEEVLAMEDAP